MSPAPRDDLYDDDLDDEDQADPPREDVVPRSQIRALEKKAKKYDEAEARASKAERDLAFAKALGPAVDDPKMAYFMKGYDGEATAEAIRQAAEEAGFLTPSPSVSNAELDGHARLTDASAGAGSIPPEDFHALLAQTKNQDEVLALAERFGLPTSRTAQ